MRVLLDANISGKGVARPLRGGGHDVLAVDEHRELSGATDEHLMWLARDQKRVLITFDVDDFVVLAARYTATEGGHSGCVLISSKSLRSDEFGVVTRSLIALFAKYPEQHDWQDRVHWLTRQAIASPQKDREPGSARGKISISKDFDEPLPDEILGHFR